MKKEKLRVKPGEIVPDSGIYEDPRSGRRCTLVKGERVPPTEEADSLWEQVVDTNPDN